MNPYYHHQYFNYWRPLPEREIITPEPLQPQQPPRPASRPCAGNSACASACLGNPFWYGNAWKYQPPQYYSNPEEDSPVSTTEKPQKPEFVSSRQTSRYSNISKLIVSRLAVNIRIVQWPARTMDADYAWVLYRITVEIPSVGRPEAGPIATVVTSWATRRFARTTSVPAIANLTAKMEAIAVTGTIVSVSSKFSRLKTMRIRLFRFKSMKNPIPEK